MFLTRADDPNQYSTYIKMKQIFMYFSVKQYYRRFVGEFCIGHCSRGSIFGRGRQILVGLHLVRKVLGRLAKSNGLKFYSSFKAKFGNHPWKNETKFDLDLPKTIFNVVGKR